jgi:hypothetical protein
MSGRVADYPHTPQFAVSLLASALTLPHFASWNNTPQPHSGDGPVSEKIFESNCGLLLEVPESPPRLATAPDGLFATTGFRVGEHREKVPDG